VVGGRLSLARAYFGDNGYYLETLSVPNLFSVDRAARPLPFAPIQLILSRSALITGGKPWVASR
jgi:hypothetical protein